MSGSEKPLDARPVSLVAVRDARERTIAVLSELFARDDLDLDEFERRVGLVHTAGSVAAIEAVTADLPALAVAPAPVPQTALVAVGEVRAKGTLLAIMGGVERHGPWSVPRKLRVVTAMGGAVLDFREARFAPGVTEATVVAIMGGAEIIVPPGLAVEVTGMAIMGGFEHVERAPMQPDPDAPLLRITGFALMGGVSLETRLVGESEREARRRRRKERKEERKQLRKGAGAGAPRELRGRDE